MVHVISTALVESTYSTYAPTAGTEGFIASREQRAMGGYSQGSSATTTVMKYLLDTARWWIPMSGPRDAADMKAGIQAQEPYDFFVYIGCGGKRDIAYDSVIPFLQGAAQDAWLKRLRIFVKGKTACGKAAIV